MFHDTPLITTIVTGLGLAFVLGAIAQRLRVPPLVGYLLARVAVGPFTPPPFQAQSRPWQAGPLANSCGSVRFEA